MIVFTEVLTDLSKNLTAYLEVFFEIKPTKYSIYYTVIFM